MISDARLGSRADNLVAVERLLSISGEDTITIDVKYKDPWTGRLPTRFLILTNELPRLTDSSGALASRFVLLTLSRSWYGREDPGLTDKLLTEAPGIFNWALGGLDRLQDRGYFVQPDSAREMLRHLEDLSSPVGAFLRARCVLGSEYEVGKDALFDEWRAWCEQEGKSRPGTKTTFFRDLRAADARIVSRRVGPRENRVYVAHGVRLLARGESPRDDHDGGVVPTHTDTEAGVRACPTDTAIVAPTRSASHGMAPGGEQEVLAEADELAAETGGRWRDEHEQEQWLHEAGETREVPQK